MVTDHVVDDFCQKDSFADAGTTKKSSLAASFERGQDIDDLDAGFKQLGCGRSFGKGRGCSMDGAMTDRFRGRLMVDDLAKDIKHARENGGSDWGKDCLARIDNGHAPGQSLCRGQGNPPDTARCYLSLDFQNDLILAPSPQNGMDSRQPFRKSDIDHTTLDGQDTSCMHRFE